MLQFFPLSLSCKKKALNLQEKGFSNCHLLWSSVYTSLYFFPTKGGDGWGGAKEEKRVSLVYLEIGL